MGRLARWRTRRAARALVRSRAGAYLDIAQVMMVALDPGGRVRMANRMVCETLGHSERELIGSDWFAVAVPPEARAGERRAYLRAMASGAGLPATTEGHVLSVAGVRVVEWHNAATRDERGRIVGTLSSGLDITDRRAAEAVLAREQEELDGLRRLAQAVAAHDDARAAVVEAVADLAGAAVAGLAEPDGDELVITAATAGGLVGRRVRLGAGGSGMARVFGSGAPFYVPDATAHPAVDHALTARSGGTSHLYQPVLLDGRAIAVLVIGWADRRERLPDRTREIAALAADEAAVALERLAALRRLEQAALVDALTGVPNRRAFDAELPRALARAARAGTPLALALLDLTRFKAVNDRDGHEAGDRLLKAAAAAWADQLRTTDMLARLGGDEFAAILPDCGPQDVPALVARLQAATPHAPGCGIGIALWDGAEDAATLIRRADKELYADKARGARGRLADPARLAAVEATGLLDAAALPELEELARTVAWLLDVPAAIVTLVDDRRQFFAAQVGLAAWAADARGTPLSHSFCRHVVATGRPLVIADARAEPLVAGSPAIEELDMVAYAGIPLVADGQAVGSLCAVDAQPRVWSDDDLLLLQRLAERALTGLGRAATR